MSRSRNTKGAGGGCEVAVIIVAYGSGDALDRALRAVEKQSVGRGAIELCVVHCGGAESARATWEQRVDHWVEPGSNVGASGGRNLGAAATSAPLLVFLDDDGVAAPEFVAAMGDMMGSDGSIVAVRGRVQSLRHPFWTSMARHYNRGAEVCDDWLIVEGAACVRRTAFEGVGGFDETLFGYEGLELSTRLLASSDQARILYNPKAALEHDFMEGWGSAFRKARRMVEAEGRVSENRNPRFESALAEYRQTRFPDGRSSLQWVMSLVGVAIFRSLRSWFRWRLKFSKG